MTYGVVRAFQVIVNAFSCSSEKAGVGDRISLVAFSCGPRYGTATRADTF